MMDEAVGIVLEGSCVEGGSAMHETSEICYSVTGSIFLGRSKLRGLFACGLDFGGLPWLRFVSLNSDIGFVPKFRDKGPRTARKSE